MSEPTHDFYLKINGLENLELTKQLTLIKEVHETVQCIDVFLLSCSDVLIKSTHQLNQSTPLQNARVSVNLSTHDTNAANNLESIYTFLDKGRQAILNCDFSSSDFFGTLIQTLTGLSIELNEQIRDDGYMDQNKCINKVKLAKVIDTFSRINRIYNTDYAFEINSVSGNYRVKTIDKTKAIDLLGGKYVDNKCFIGDFIVNKIIFEDIEGELEFILDGNPIKAFITHKQWITDFNNHQIKIAKGDRIKAKTIAERSPLNNKIVAYHFVEIVGINI